MITVAIYINGFPIIARSARNCGEKDEEGRTKYEVDDCNTIWHKREDGAIELAKQMLDRVKELGK